MTTAIAGTASATRSTDLAAFFRLLHAPGIVAEIRAPNCPDKPGGTFKGTASGYIDNPEAAAKLAKSIDAKQPAGVYVTINPVAPALLARSANRIDWRAKSTTADVDILRRVNLLIDVDSVRPAGVSATEEEMQAALGLARRIAGELAADGWPAPIVGMSGNGGYLFYRIDLPNDPPATDLCQRVLLGLAERFNTDAAKIDTTTYNASRIAKILGTTARKGSDFNGSERNPARPWRQSWYEPPAGELATVPRELLESVASDPKPAPAIVGPAPSTNGHHKPDSRLKRYRAFAGKMPDAISGQGGHNATLAVACECFRFGLSDDEARAEMANFNANRTGGEPWSDRELEHKLSNARAKVEEAGEFAMRLQERKRQRSTTRQPAQSGGEPAGDVPIIDADEKDLATITPQAVAALAASNNPPTLFRHGGLPARIETGDTGEPIIRALDFHRTRHELSRRMRFQSITTRGENETVKLVAPPKDVVNDVLATPDIGLPVLNRIVEAPVFAPDGSLQTTPGYHPASGVFYSPAAGFTIPAVSPNPTAADVDEARELIASELLGEFPFVDGSELAHAVGLFILPAARDLIDGPTPLHLVEKPSPGSGATLLVDAITYWAVGRPIAAMSEGRDEDEWRKRITAKLRSGAAFGALDNLRRRLDSAAFSSMLTCCWWEDRILGFTEMVRLPNRMIWVATGNNPALSNEITRRTIRIRLDPKQDRPWLRTGFRHADLRGWVAENRGRLAWAALTCVSAWLSAGRPAGGQTLGMFEAWAKTIGGILDVVGVSGFLGNLESFYEDSDTESAAWRSFLVAWFGAHGPSDVLVKDLHPLAVDCGIGLGDGKEQSQKVLLGKLLVERRDRVFDVQFGDTTRRLRIAKGGTFRRATQWAIEVCDSDSCESVSLGESIRPYVQAHARPHAPAHVDTVGNTHTDSQTHTDEADTTDELAYEPWE